MINVRRRSLISKIFEPFSTADTIELYASRGYWFIGGLMLLLLLLFFWVNGLLGYTVDKLPEAVQNVFKLIASAVKITTDISRLTVVIIFVLIFVAAGLIPGIKRRAGKIFADIFFGIICKGVDAGELFIANRRASLIVIIVLTSALIIGSYSSVSTMMQNAETQHNLQLWVQRADDIVNKTTLSRGEPEKFHSLGQPPQRSTSFFTTNSSSDPPIDVLSKMLTAVYIEEKKTDDVTWLSLVAERLKDLEKIAATSSLDAADTDESDIRAQSLVHIMMGRIYIRAFEDAFTRPDTMTNDQYQFLAKAKSHFEDAGEILDKRVGPNTSWLPLHRASVQNGLGLVYSTIFSVLSTRSADSSVPGGDLIKICSDMNVCLERSRAAFTDAGKGFEPCSFEGKRQMNNLADLLMRLGSNYDTASMPRSRIKTSKNLERTELAQELAKATTEMLSCSGTGPFVPNTFVTAAQAYATAAKLKLSEGQPAEHEVLSSAYYLRLSYNFDEKNLPDWDLSPFCFLRSDGGSGPKLKGSAELVSTFYEHLEKPILGLKPLGKKYFLDKLTGSGKCR